VIRATCKVVAGAIAFGPVTTTDARVAAAMVVLLVTALLYLFLRRTWAKYSRRRQQPQIGRTDGHSLLARARHQLRHRHDAGSRLRRAAHLAEQAQKVRSERASYSKLLDFAATQLTSDSVAIILTVSKRVVQTKIVQTRQQQEHHHKQVNITSK